VRKTFLLLGLAACSAHPGGIDVKRSSLARELNPSASDVAQLGSDDRAFAFALYRQAVALNPDANLVLSPYSASTALTMAYAGARGTTESQLRSALHFTLDQAPLHQAFNATDLALASRGQGASGTDGTPFKLHVDNSLWLRSGFTPLATFLDTLARNYGAPVYVTDFRAPEAARAAINTWVSDKTEQRVTELLHVGDISPETDAVLTNTVYFNASWATPFVPSATEDARFNKLDGSTVTARMMHASESYPYAEGADFQAVSLPYSSPELGLIAVLPEPGRFAAVEAALSAQWFDALRWSRQDLALGLPKWDDRSHFSLVDALRALGVRAAFEPGEADFSGMTPAQIYIARVIQEAMIEVTEQGTVAAGATAVVFAHKSAKLSQQLPLTFDRPFLYMIFDQPTGSILFIGRVLEP
jgi:serpin B